MRPARLLELAELTQPPGEALEKGEPRMPATGARKRIDGRRRTPAVAAAVLAALAGMATGSGCGSSTTTTLNVTVQTDATLLGMLDEIAVAADAVGRHETATRFTALSQALHWTIRIGNTPAAFAALVTATGRSAGHDVITTAALATVTPGQAATVILTLTANCAGPQAPACRADELCADGACIPKPVLQSADGGMDAERPETAGHDASVEAAADNAGTPDASGDDIKPPPPSPDGASDGVDGADAAASDGPRPDTAPPAGAPGASCGADRDCGSSHCVKGICCDKACTAGCYSCVAADTGGDPGVCLPLQAGKSDGTCTAKPEATCKETGACDGKGGCQLQPPNVECAAATCVGTSFTPAAKCNGSGDCGDRTTQDCGPYRCDGTNLCKSSCVVDGDCGPESFCTGTVCTHAVCAVSGWCWHNPRPHGLTVNGIWGADPKDVWSVAAGGAIARWNGSIWQGFDSITEEDLLAVDGAQGMAWAVGTRGTILKWDGFTWRHVSSPTSTDIYFVKVLSPTDIWISNWSTGVWHWDGTNWRAVPMPVADFELGAISGLSSDNVWIAGYHNVYHWDGNIMSFESLDSFLPGSWIDDVLVDPSGDVWATTSGCADTGNPILTRHDGNWSVVGLTACSDRDGRSLLAREPGGRMWVVGEDQTLVSWDPTKGDTGPMAAPPPFLDVQPTAVAAPGDNNLFMASRSVYLWDGTSVSNTFDGPTELVLSVIFPNPNSSESWILGRLISVDTHLYQRQAGVWEPIQTPGVLYGLGSASGRVWAFGPTVLRRYGSTWDVLLTNTSTTDAIFAMDSQASGSIWLVGSGGKTWTVANRGDGTLDQSVISGTSNNLNAVAALSDTDVWAVGDRATVVHRGGTGSFVSVPIGVDATTQLSSVCAASAQDIWIVGSKGTVVHGSGASWTSATQGLGTATLSKIVCPDGDPWAISTDDRAWHYAAGVWSPDNVGARTTTVSPGLANIAASVTPRSVWVVGGSGAVLERTR